jgi:hypothetical protein
MFARPPLTVALGGLVLLTACGGASRGSRGPGEAAPARSSDVVTLEDLAKVSSASTLFEALHMLRPNWFLRNPSTLRPEKEGDIVVYLDQSRLGGPEALRTIQVVSVTLVRHYSASEAEARFGLGHLHGAIQVVTTR